MSPRAQPPVPLPEARWPTADEAGSSLLFSEVRIGPFVAPERTWVPAMVPWRATEDGFVTPDNLDWYGRFAAGAPGVLVAEATGIRDVRSGPLLRIGHDRFVPGLRELVARVRERSEGRTRFLVQLIDFLAVRRRPEQATFFGRHLRPGPAHGERIARLTGEAGWREAPADALRAWLLAAAPGDLDAVLTPRELRDLRYGYREEVNDTHLPHVAELPRVLPGLFADAAERALHAGFDGVELHFAHAYTMASFLSRTNRRTDGYGSTPQGRVRLPLEVIAAVRERVGRDLAVGLRYLGDEVVPGGSRIEDAVWQGLRFCEAGVDFLSVSKGGRFEDAKQPRVGHAVYPYTGPSGHECMPTVRIDARGPFGRNVPLAASIRRTLRAAGHDVPVVTAGGLCTFDQCERILREGEADVIASARQSLADPDWFRKMRLGHGDAIRRCQFTNYCEGLDQVHAQVTCKLWDKAFAPGEEGVTLARDGRRRLVAPAWAPGQRSGIT